MWNDPNACGYHRNILFRPLLWGMWVTDNPDSLCHSQPYLMGRGSGTAPVLWHGGLLMVLLMYKPFLDLSHSSSSLSNLPTLSLHRWQAWKPFWWLSPPSQLTPLDPEGISPNKHLVCITVSWHLLLGGPNPLNFHLQQEKGWSQCAHVIGELAPLRQISELGCCPRTLQICSSSGPLVVLSTLQVFMYLMVSPTFWRTAYHHLHFTDEKTGNHLTSPCLDFLTLKRGRW